MPQLVKGGEHVFGWSRVGPGGEVRIPPQALDEYQLQDHLAVILVSGSRTSGGFGMMKPDLIEVSPMGVVLGECPNLTDERSEGMLAPESEGERPTADQQRAAENAFHLLHSWNIPPGLQPDGTLDGETLRTWFQETSGILEEVDRLEVGEVHIGHVLESSPPDPDDSWPPQVVRDFLEEIQNDRVERGLRIQILNSRGVTTRSPGEGGAQERALANDYRNRATGFETRWPRTAALLRGAAESYEYQAQDEESEAERFRQGFGM